MQNNMKKPFSLWAFAFAFCVAMLSVSCTKEEVFPETAKSSSLYNSLLPLWQLRESPRWHAAVEQYAGNYNYALTSDTIAGGYRRVTYLRQDDTGIFVLQTFGLNDTLWTLHCSLFSRRQQWMQNQMVRFEQEMYSRHPDGYIGGSFYWYLRPDILNAVDGGDVRTHDLFVQRAREHANAVWEWVEARAHYGLRPPYLAEDQLQLHTDGTRHYLSQLGLDSIPPGITHHLDIQFHVYDTTGWSNLWNLD